MNFDPNLFHIDWERLGESLVALVVLSFFLERALAPLFESRFFIKRFQHKSLKELIAFIVASVVCLIWNFDLISILFLTSHVTVFGCIITGAIVAGGSKASVTLFKNVLGVRSLADEMAEKREKNEMTRDTKGKLAGVS